MPSPIKNVIVIGASGNLGPAILQALLAASFKVSVLSRKESSATFPDNVNVFKTDYSSESVQAAFTGQDAVVSTIASAKLGEQQKIIDAAVAAGVKRFIPSEFGSNTTNPAITEIVPFFANKQAPVEYLRTKESQISWTAIMTGPFFDWGLKVGILGFNIAERKATLWDDGAARFSSSSLSTIGKAVAAVLSDRGYEKTKNRYIAVAGVKDLTQRRILASFEKATGQKWETSAVSADEKIKEGTEKFKNGDYASIYTLIQGATFRARDELAMFEETANDDLGITDEDIDDVVKSVL